MLGTRNESTVNVEFIRSRLRYSVCVYVPETHLPCAFTWYAIAIDRPYRQLAIRNVRLYIPFSKLQNVRCTPHTLRGESNPD